MDSRGSQHSTTMRSSSSPTGDIGDIGRIGGAGTAGPPTTGLPLQRALGDLRASDPVERPVARGGDEPGINQFIFFLCNNAARFLRFDAAICRP